MGEVETCEKAVKEIEIKVEEKVKEDQVKIRKS